MFWKAEKQNWQVPQNLDTLFENLKTVHPPGLFLFIAKQASPVGFALWGHGRGRLFVYTAVILGEPRCLVGVRRSDRIKIECQKLKIKNTGRDI